MADKDHELDRVVPLRKTREGLRRLAAIAVAIGMAIVIMYGEVWAIERAPGSMIASGLTQTADFTRALDNALAAQASASTMPAL